MARMTLFGTLAIALTVACGDKDDNGGEDTGSTGVDGPVDSDGDGFAAEEDCNDSDAAVNPDAEETCDGVDNDCNGEIDEGVQSVFYADADADGYGTAAVSIEACEAPSGFADNADDCDDSDAAFNPGADEDDCADPNDYNCDGSVGYEDADGDGYAACEDCNDADAAINPGATEVCDEAGVDEDCDDQINDGDDSLDASTGVMYYADADTDGYGDSADAGAWACELPSGTVADNTDCDDTNIDVNPGATEVCDEADVDEDCDGAADDADDSVSDQGMWYADADTDGYGDSAGAATMACDMPSGMVADNTDCDDANIDVNPGATEVCDADDTDEDCNGAADDADSGVDASTQTTAYSDADGDGYGDVDDAGTLSCEMGSGMVEDNTDCDDTDSAINPGAEVSCAYVDGNCDGLIDAIDNDGDAFPSCLGDCDDANAAVHPYAWEDTSDGIDNDCDGDADTADTSTVTTLWSGSGDDSSSQFTPSNGWTFPFCDDLWSDFYVQTNGQVMFGWSHTDYSESASEFLSDGPAIALWDDYRPASGGAIYAVEHADAVGIYFEAVPDFYSSGNNTFAIVMHENGLIHFTSESANDGDKVTGWSCGDDSGVAESALSTEIADLPVDAIGLNGYGARAHYEDESESTYTLEGQRWFMCATAGNDLDGDGWTDICGDWDDRDAASYPGTWSPSTGGDTGDTGDTGGILSR